MHKSKLIIFSILGALVELEAEGMHDRYSSSVNQSNHRSVNFANGSSSYEQNISAQKRRRKQAIMAFNSLNEYIRNELYEIIQEETLSKRGQNNIIQQLNFFQTKVGRLTEACKEKDHQIQILSNQLQDERLKIKELENQRSEKARVHSAPVLSDDQLCFNQKQGGEVRSAPVSPINSVETVSIPRRQTPFKLRTHIQSLVQAALKDDCNLSYAREVVLQSLLDKGFVEKTPLNEILLNDDPVYSARLKDGTFVTPVTSKLPYSWKDLGLYVDSSNNLHIGIR